MSNSCEQTPILSNTAEIADNIGWVKNTPLPWNKLGCYRYERRKRKKTEEKIRGFCSKTRRRQGERISKVSRIFEETRYHNYKRVTPKHNLLRWSKSTSTFFLIPHSAVVS